ncbi:MAG: type II secretion system F family protein [Chloroflexi bacterium]|nr:type II secretion system F family protein [Chloroflexota bacterium]MBV9600657.1 type II secretion system F family protein [Chloroflexota bacterium]
MRLLALANGLSLTALDARVVVLPLLLGGGLYLILTALPLGRPKRDLGERLRRLDVDERVRTAELDRQTRRQLFTSRLLENMLRPIVEDAGRGLRSVLVRLGLGGGRELEMRLTVIRPGVDVAQFMGEKVAGGVIVAAMFPLMNLLRLTPFGAWPVWLWLVGFGFGFVLPDWDLDRRAARQRGLVLMELPTILDMLTLATSAGMALEQALEEVARQSEGVVARELRVATRELALGQRHNLPDALAGLAQRLGTPEVNHILGRMSAAYEQGLPLGQTLPAQAQALRERQRLHVVEEGGKTAVRMLLPVALLILPALFVVVLLPAAAELTRLGGI